VTKVIKKQASGKTQYRSSSAREHERNNDGRTVVATHHGQEPLPLEQHATTNHIVYDNSTVYLLHLPMTDAWAFEGCTGSRAIFKRWISRSTSSSW